MLMLMHASSPTLKMRKTMLRSFASSTKMLQRGVLLIVVHSPSSSPASPLTSNATFVPPPPLDFGKPYLLSTIVRIFAPSSHSFANSKTSPLTPPPLLRPTPVASLTLHNASMTEALSSLSPFSLHASSTASLPHMTPTASPSPLATIILLLWLTPTTSPSPLATIILLLWLTPSSGYLTVKRTFNVTLPLSMLSRPAKLPQATTTAEEVAAQVAPAVVVVDVVVGEEEDVMVAEVVAVVGVADTPHPRAPSPLCQYIIRYGSNKVQHLLPSSTPTPTPPPTPPPQASPLHYPPPYAGWPYPPYPPPGYGHGPTAPTANLAEQPSSSSNPPGFTPFPIGHVSTAPADSLYAHTINESLFQYFAFSSSSSCLEFILDSGATHTVLRDAGTLVPLHTPSTIHGADSSFTITSRHTSTLPCPIFPSGTVTGLYIPSLRNNLVALCDLTRFGITALFPGHAHHCDLFHTTTGRFICRIPL
ncbi:unnamed protein product [Closterium sp. NIES-54]